MESSMVLDLDECFLLGPASQEISERFRSVSMRQLSQTPPARAHSLAVIREWKPAGVRPPWESKVSLSFDRVEHGLYPLQLAGATPAGPVPPGVARRSGPVCAVTGSGPRLRVRENPIESYGAEAATVISSFAEFDTLGGEVRWAG